MDKIGHFYAASILAFAVKNAIEWADVPERNALWLGSATSFIFQTYVEIEDGFSAWGFDRVDFLTNTLGAAWPILRYEAPFFQNFDLKLSYLPSQLIHNPGGVGFRGQKHLMMDDYEGQSFWLSVKVNNFLPNRLEPYWPDFLCLALGYGARDIAVQSSEPHRVYFLAFDLDMTKVIPQKSDFLKRVGQALNFIHLPSPAVRISPSTIWYGVYF